MYETFNHSMHVCKLLHNCYTLYITINSNQWHRKKNKKKHGTATLVILNTYFLYTMQDVVRHMNEDDINDDFVESYADFFKRLKGANSP